MPVAIGEDAVAIPGIGEDAVPLEDEGTVLPLPPMPSPTLAQELGQAQIDEIGARLKAAYPLEQPPQLSTRTPEEAADNRAILAGLSGPPPGMDLALETGMKMSAPGALMSLTPEGEGLIQGAAQGAAGMFTLPNAGIALATEGAGLVPEAVAKAFPVARKAAAVTSKAMNQGGLAYFAAQAIDQFPELKQQYDATEDPKEKARLLAHAAISLALPVGGAVHTAFTPAKLGPPPLPSTKKDLTSTKGGESDATKESTTQTEAGGGGSTETPGAAPGTEVGPAEPVGDPEKPYDWQPLPAAASPYDSLVLAKQRAGGVKQLDEAAKRWAADQPGEAEANPEDFVNKVVTAPAEVASYFRPPGELHPAELDRLVEEYRKLPGTDNGAIMDVDRIRELFPEYLADRTRSGDVHDRAQQVAAALKDRELARPVRPGKAPEMVILAGGPGVGKSSYALPEALGRKSDIIYDTTLGKLDYGIKDIEAALATGRTVYIPYTWRDPVEAYRSGVLERATKDEKKFGSGRSVPSNVAADIHINARQTIEKLVERYKDDPRVTFEFIDNSRGYGNARVTTLDAIPQLGYYDVHGNLEIAREQAYRNGEISERTYRASRPSFRAVLQRPEGIPSANGTVPSGLSEQERPRGPPNPVAVAQIEAANAASPAAATAPAVVPTATKVTEAIPNLQTREVPLKDIILSKDVPQFKHGANEKGVVEPLAGKYERTGTPPVQLWKRLNGQLELITGRHRFDLAQRTGEKTIPSQIHAEADGFTQQKAAMLDAEINIRDNQGSTADYANYFRNSRIPQADAEARGLLARAKGKAGFRIATGASEDLFALHQRDRVTDSQAEAIATAAPGNASAQQIGIKAALDGKSAEYVKNLIKAAVLRAPGVAQGDLLSFDDSAMREMDKQAARASKIQRGIREQISAVQGAAKRPAIARKLGVDVADPEGVQKRVEELRGELARWENWPMQPDLVAATRGEKFVPAPESTPPAPELTTPAPGEPPAAPAEIPESTPAFELAPPESVEEQKSRLAGEATAAANREAVAAGAAKPLEGTVGDIGQADMFGSEELPLQQAMGAASVHESLASYEQRKFAERFQADQKIAQDIKDATGNRYYEPIPQIKTMEDAKALLAQRGPAEAIKILTTATEKDLPFEIRSAMGQLAIKQLNEVYLRLKDTDPAGAARVLDQAADASEKVAELGTALGRGVASFKMWQAMTAEGKLIQLRRQAAKLRDQFTKDHGTEVQQVLAHVNYPGFTEGQKLSNLKGLARTGNKVARMVKPDFMRILAAMREGLPLDVQDFYDMEASRLGLPNLTPAKLRELHAIAAEVDAAHEGLPKDRASFKLSRFIAQETGFPAKDLPLSIYYGNILSGYNTHIVNFADTLLNVLSEGLGQAMTNPRAAALIYSEMFRGFVDGRSDALLALTEGRMITSGKYFDAPKLTEVARFGQKGGVPIRTDTFSGRVMKALGESKIAAPLNAWKYVTRMLSASDSIMFRGAFDARMAVLADRLGREEGLHGRALDARIQQLLGRTPGQARDFAAQAASEGLKGAPARARAEELRVAQLHQDARADAEDFAGVATYNHKPEGVAGFLADKAQQIGAKYPAFKAFVPFTQIVANVTNRGLSYTPLGFVRGLWHYGGKRLTGDARSAMLMRATLGTAGLSALGAMQAAGFISIHGNGPSDPERRRQLISAGWKPYSIQLHGSGIDNRYFTYTYNPLGLGLSVIGNMADSYRYNEMSKKDAVTRAGYAASRIGSTIFSQSFLSGLSNLFEALSGQSADAVTGIKKALAQTSTALTTPNAIRDVYHLFDSKRYDSNTLAGDLIRNTPFASLVLKPTLNAFGEPIRPSTNRFIGKLTDDPVWRKIVQYNLRVPVPDKYTDMPTTEGKLRPITPEEYYRYLKVTGPLVKRLAAGMQFQNVSPDVAQQMLDAGAQSIRGEVLKQLRVEALQNNRK